LKEEEGTAMAVIFPPDRMMIIEDDGSEKHERMFTLKNGEVEWWKPNDEWWKPNRWTRANKSPSTLRTVERYGKSEAGLLRLVTSNGVNRIVRPRDDEMRERWLTARLSDKVDGRPSDTEEMRLRTRNVERKPHTAAPRRVKPPRRSSGSLADDALSDPGSDVSEPSLLSTPPRADFKLAALKQREEKLRRREEKLRREELELERSALHLSPARYTPHRRIPARYTPHRRVVRQQSSDYDLSVGQRVEYQINQRWLQATVRAFNRDGSVMLDLENGCLHRNADPAAVWPF
jgi:hypothetical protein